MAVADLVAEWFDNDLVRATIASRAIFGHFAGPWSAGTGGLLMQRMADDPMPCGSGMTVAGGPGALSRALQTVAETAGVKIRTNATVARIRTHGGSANGVILEDGEEIASRVVLGALDPKATLQQLVDPADLPPVFSERVRNIRARGVTAKVNLALSERPIFDAPTATRLPCAADCSFSAAPAASTISSGLSTPPARRDAGPPVARDQCPDCHRRIACAGRPARDVDRRAHDSYRLRDESADEHDLLSSVMSVLAPHAPNLESLIAGREVIMPSDIERDRVGRPHLYHGKLWIIPCACFAGRTAERDQRTLLTGAARTAAAA